MQLEKCKFKIQDITSAAASSRPCSPLCCSLRTAPVVLRLSWSTRRLVYHGRNSIDPHCVNGHSAAVAPDRQIHWRPPLTVDQGFVWVQPVRRTTRTHRTRDELGQPIRSHTLVLSVIKNTGSHQIQEWLTSNSRQRSRSPSSWWHGRRLFGPVSDASWQCEHLREYAHSARSPYQTDLAFCSTFVWCLLDTRWSLEILECTARWAAQLAAAS